MVAMRWSVRGIGFLSTIILARLLAPEDFGIVAMAMVVVGLLQVVMWTGVDLALIRDANATREHYDTAWTIRLIQALFLAALLLIVAPFTETYFHEPRTVGVIQALALSAFFGSVENIGTVAFRKELDFAKDFRYGVYKKLISFVIVVISAFVLRDYRALVVGMIASAMAEAVLSFTMHPYRPRLCLTKIREIWSFSMWMLISRVGQFLNQKSDQFVIGGSFGTAFMGRYHMGYELGTLFTTEIVMPIGRAMFPHFSLVQNDPKQLKDIVINTLGAVAIVCISISVGLAVVAEDFVAVVLGNKWMEVIPLIQWLALYGGVAGMSIAMETTLLVTNNARLSALESWSQLLVLVPVLIFAASFGDIVRVAEYRTGVAVVFLPVMFYLITRVVPVRFGELLLQLWRPVLAAVAMAFVVRTLHADGISSPIIRLILDTLTGALTFLTALIAVWWLSGGKEGPEKTAIRLLSERIQVARKNRHAQHNR